MSTQDYVDKEIARIEEENRANAVEILTDEEKDTLGEIGNICMGTSATTLSTLLDKRVSITTPKVSVCNGSEIFDEYVRPIVSTEVSYTEGLDGNNVFLLKKEDALTITSLLMGGDGSGTEKELGELYLSAISEVMNQMVGSSSTALADILHITINIAPPKVKELTNDEKDFEKTLYNDQVLIKTSFKMEIEGLLESNIMQVMPYKFGKVLVSALIGDNEAETAQQLPVQKEEVAQAEPAQQLPEQKVAETTPPPSASNVELKAVKYQSFNNTAANDSASRDSDQNIDLIMDVPLKVTVVLGNSKKSIKEILDLNMGSVIILDRLAGEMVDVLVNGKLFAKGEVVVIDDNYGVRITEKISTTKAAEAEKRKASRN